MTKCKTCLAALALLLALGCGDEGEGAVRAGPTAGTGTGTGTGDSGGTGATADTAGTADTATTFDTIVAGSTAGLFLDGFFPIAIYGAHPTDFQRYDAAGVNTAFDIADLCYNEGGQTVCEYTDQEWDELVIAQGWKAVRKPIGDLATDAAKPHLLAWNHRDEPDIGTGSKPYYDETIVHTTIPANAAAWRAAAPDQEIIVQLAGIDLDNEGPYGCNGPGDAEPSETSPEGRTDCYSTLIAASDWISNDFYPIGFDQLYSTGDIRQISDPLDKIRGKSPWSTKWSDNPLFAMVETSWFDTATGSREPTVGEVRAQIWQLIIHEARGITYFINRVGPPGFLWDNTPDHILAEIATQNGKITALSDVLQDAINPGSISAVASHSEIEAGWRDTTSGKFFFVLNTQASPKPGATVTLTGIGAATTATVYGEGRTVPVVGGVITDDFGPQELHIYVVEE